MGKIGTSPTAPCAADREPCRNSHPSRLASASDRIMLTTPMQVLPGAPVEAIASNAEESSVIENLALPEAQASNPQQSRVAVSNRRHTIDATNMGAIQSPMDGFSRGREYPQPLAAAPPAPKPRRISNCFLRRKSSTTDAWTTKASAAQSPSSSSADSSQRTREGGTGSFNKATSSFTRRFSFTEDPPPEVTTRRRATVYNNIVRRGANPMDGNPQEQIAPVSARSRRDSFTSACGYYRNRLGSISGAANGPTSRRLSKSSEQDSMWLDSLMSGGGNVDSEKRFKEDSFLTEMYSTSQVRLLRLSCATARFAHFE